MQSSLRSFSGPRIKYTPEDSPYEAISVDKLTPIIGAEIGRKFGDLHIHPAAPSEPGHPELMIIHADKDSFRANGEGWHSDVSCDSEPPMGSILYIRKCPPRGGDTLFANMYAAYEALSDRMT